MISGAEPDWNRFGGLRWTGRLSLVQPGNLNPENPIVPSRGDSTEVSIFGKGNRSFEKAIANFHRKQPHALDRKCQLRLAHDNRRQIRQIERRAECLAANGIVDPADSITFVAMSNCSFYKWSEQMFLWLTSPVPSRYGSGSHVFDSPVFYSVSPQDATGQRTLIPHVPGRPLRFLPVISQRGNRGEEVVFDNTGKIHNVLRVPAGPNGKLQLRDQAGQPVEIERIVAMRSGRPMLLDKADKQIDVEAGRSSALQLLNAVGAPISLRPATVLVNGIAHLITTSGAVVMPEEGQAGGREHAEARDLPQREHAIKEYAAAEASRNE